MSYATYPINLFSKSYTDDEVKNHTDIYELSKTGAWAELFEHSDVRWLINCSKLPVEEENQPPSLYTPLHYAAVLGASKDVFEKLLQLGAAKCLKTANGETAYDIAKSNELSSDILAVLEIPQEIKQNSQSIDKMEQGLHTVINGRVEDLIKSNGQSLPQLAWLYEKGEFHYPVWDMCGGFNVSKRRDGIEVYSFIRICGGSEEIDRIDKEGNVTPLQLDITTMREKIRKLNCCK